MAKFECNESEGLSCVARLQSMDPAARWQDSEEEKWANHGDLFVGGFEGGFNNGGGFYVQFFENDNRETRCQVTYSSYKGFTEESIKALLCEAIKTPIIPQWQLSVEASRAWASSLKQ